MVDLDFAVDGITVEPYAAIPTLAFALRVGNATPALVIENVMLNCQIRIEPARRRYGAPEHERLADLFGSARTLGPDFAKLSVDPCERRGGRFRARLHGNVAGPVQLRLQCRGNQIF